MIRTLLELRAAPGRAADLCQTIDALGVLSEHAYAQPGFHGGEVLKGSDDRVLVIALWESSDAYQAWLDNPVREGLVEALTPLLSHQPRGRVYAVEQVVDGL